MKKLLFLSIVLGLAITAYSQDIFTEQRTLYVGENATFYFPIKTIAISNVSVSVISGNVNINSYGSDRLNVTGNATGYYEIHHIIKYADLSTATNICKGEIQRKSGYGGNNGNNNDGGDEPVIVPGDPNDPPIIW